MVLAVETPDGKLITPANAAAFGVTFDAGANLETARFNLPVAFQAHKVHAGTWYVQLEVDDRRLKRLLAGDNTNVHAGLADLRAKGAKYCVSVHSFSNLRMNAAVSQTSFVPGATLSLRASLTEYAQPVVGRARVRAELQYPDGTQTVISLSESEPGIHTASLTASLPGTYRFRFLAEGATYRGAPFTREQLATAAVWNGGDQPSTPPKETGKDDLCRLITCLLSEKNLSPDMEARLKGQGISLAGIRDCFRRYCAASVHRTGGE